MAIFGTCMMRNGSGLAWHEKWQGSKQVGRCNVWMQLGNIVIIGCQT